MQEYIVSARKYRPMTFSTVVGQTALTTTLKNAIASDKLAHAYLFCGPRGVGKTTCARIFAKAINCLNPIGSEACNECESCRAFNEGRSMNIHELDAASNNSVDDIRSLIEQVRIMPQIGKYSLFIIDEVHMLSQQAFNAFLKTLEEPPKHAVFILATTEKHKIIPTILSRCQVYDFNRIRVEDSVDYLKHIAEQEGVTYDEESLNLIAQKADGGMRDALSMFDKAVSFCGTTLDYHSVAQTLNVLDYDTYFRMTELLTAGNYTEALVAFDEVLSKGFSGQTFMAGLNRHLRDLLMARQPDTLKLIEMTGTLMERYRKQAASTEAEFLFGAISILTELDGKIRQASNGRLLVELGLMKIARLGQKKKIDDEELYELPALEQRTVRTAPTAPQATPAAPQPTVAPPTTEPQPRIEPAQATTATTPATEAAAQHSEAPAPQPEPRPVHRTATIGLSLSALLAEEERPKEEQTTEESIGPVIDPQAEEKLRNNRAAILAMVRTERPRFYPSFERLEVAGNELQISVPSRELHDEIQRNRTALLMQIARIAKVEGLIELKVDINEELRAEKPIKLEDRLRHLTEKNPKLVALRKALDMEVE